MALEKRIHILSKELTAELSPLVDIQGNGSFLSCTALTKVTILQRDFKYSAEHVSIMQINQKSLQIKQKSCVQASIPTKH